MAHHIALFLACHKIKKAQKDAPKKKKRMQIGKVVSQKIATDINLLRNSDILKRSRLETLSRKPKNQAS